MSNVHLKKALSPIFVTLSGISILVSNLHPAKAPSPIFVTLFGILILVSDLHSEKALFTITFTPSLIEYSPFNPDGALSNLFQSLLYFTPNSSSIAFSISSFVTSVLHTSSSFGFCTSFTFGFCTSSSFGFCTPNNLKEHIDKFFLALAKRNIDIMVLASSSANKPCRAVMVLLLLKSR